VCGATRVAAAQAPSGAAGVAAAAAATRVNPRYGCIYIVHTCIYSCICYLDVVCGATREVKAHGLAPSVAAVATAAAAALYTDIPIYIIFIYVCVYICI